MTAALCAYGGKGQRGAGEFGKDAVSTRGGGAMHASQRQLEDVTVLEIRDTIHCGDGQDELERILSDLADRGCVRLVLNLKEVSHIDSTCLGVFVAAQVRCRKRGGAIGLLQTPLRIRQLLSMARLDLFLPSYSTEEEAIGHVVAASVMA